MNTYTFDLGMKNKKIVAVGENLNSDNEFFKVATNGKTGAIVRKRKVNYILVNNIG